MYTAERQSHERKTSIIKRGNRNAFLTTEDYDVFKKQVSAACHACLNTLTKPEDSQECKSLENEYNIVMIKTMEEIRKV